MIQICNKGQWSDGRNAIIIQLFSDQIVKKGDIFTKLYSKRTNDGTLNSEDLIRVEIGITVVDILKLVEWNNNPEDRVFKSLDQVDCKNDVVCAIIVEGDGFECIQINQCLA